MINPPAPVTYSTLASANLTEGLFTTNIIPTSLLVKGDNILAVEVHQITMTSADFVLGMGLTGFVFPPTGLAITSNPTDRVIDESSSTTFSVGFSGTGAKVQWYKWVHGAAVAIAEATHASFTITNVSLADAGFYFVVLSNLVNQVTSSPALLT